MTVAARTRPRAFARPWGLNMVDATVLLVAAKPLLDAISERSGNVRLDLGTAWTGLALVLLVIDSVRRNGVGIPYEAWMLRIAVVALVSTGIVRGLIEQNPSIALEWTRVAVGFAPAGILLSFTIGRSLGIALRRWRFVFAASIGVHVTVAWLQFFGLMGTTYRQAGMGRPSGLFFHPITLGYLLVAVILALAVLSARGHLPRWLALVATTLAYATIIVTTHRTSFVAASFVLAAWALIALVRTRRIRVKHVVTLSVGVLLTASVAWFTLPTWSPIASQATLGLSNVITAQDLDVTSDRFLRGRGERWTNTVAMLDSGGALEVLVGYGFEIVDPHSDYLRLPLVHGALGALLILAAWAAFWLGVMRRGDGEARLWSVVALATMAIFAITTKPTSYPSFMWAWAIVAVVAMASGPQSRRPDAAE